MNLLLHALWLKRYTEKYDVVFIEQQMSEKP